MKKVKKALMTLLPSFFILAMSACSAESLSEPILDSLEEDTALISGDNTHAKLGAPDVSNKVRAGDDDEEEDPEVIVNMVKLHYYNEAGGNEGRAFYLWCTGEDGVEYNLDNASDIFNVTDGGKMMNITIDFTTPRFAKFAGKSKLYFIIKYKMKSPTDLNWGGQSDDMQLIYADFPPEEGSDVCEVWTMPAAGGGIAILSSEAQTKVPGIQLAKFTDWNTISCQFTSTSKKANYKLYAFDETYYKIKPKRRAEVEKWYLVKEGTLTSTTGGTTTISLPFKAHINLVYSLVTHDPSTDIDPVMAKLNKTVTIGYDKLYETKYFHDHYEPINFSQKKDDERFGVTYTPTQTTFRVWSPITAKMTVMLYDIDTPKEFAKEDEKEVADLYEGYHMHYHSGGIWELTIEGDLAGKYYNYQIDNVLGNNIVMDPYATSAGANGLRGFIYDKESTNPEGWNTLPLRWDGETEKGLDIDSPQDLSIYEVHVQDFTGDASWENASGKSTKRGTYNAFVESGAHVSGTSVSAGYDHLNELGVKAVQLVPVFDHDNDETTAETTDGLKYNWGYNPLNYNVVEGGYSSDIHDGAARVREFKNLVLEMSKTEVHTRVIMDVVYNHVSSATGSNFHALMPRYYFRYAGKDYYNEKGEKYQSAGELWDGSGCHNEVATERPMMRKFIVDSLCMWATDYKIKGFRFDLMGLIDFKTLVKAKEALHDIDPDIYMYGEGWALGYHGEGSDQWKAEHPGAEDPHNFGGFTWQVYNECNNYKTSGVYLGGFNDAFRDAMRGSNGDKGGDGKTYPNKGFLQLGAWKENNGSWYTDFAMLDKIAKGAWGINTNGMHTKGMYFPEQTVNYVSCHDNWTVRDQLFQTLPYYTDEHGKEHHASAERILRGSLAAHAMVMAANTPAFMLGGEEFLRTKEFTKDLYPTEDKIPSYVTADSWTELWGHRISHNSYNAPANVNTFKWTNKISVDIDGEVLTNDEFHYNEAFRSLVRMHSTTIKKRGTTQENEAFLAESYVSPTDHRALTNGIYFSKTDDDWANTIGFQINEIFIYLCGGNIGTEDLIKSEVNEAWKKFDYGNYTLSSSGIKFGVQQSSAVFDRHGH